MTTALRVPTLTMDPLQRAAAEAPEGPTMILGGPGTGKTHTLIARVAMLLKGGASPHNITCLTFSSRGAEDLRRDIESQPMTAPGAPHMFIGTVHYFASFFLRRAGYASLGISPQFTIWDQEQAEETMTEIIDRRRGGRDKDKASSKEIRAILEWYGRNQTQIPEEAAPPEDPEWMDIMREYNQEKRRNNTLGLDDLIPLAVRGMETNPEARAVWNQTRTRHLLVDEFQDITPRQYHLVQLMTGPTRSITIAADPNQSINRWKGADSKLIVQFRLDHGTRLNTKMLKVNHRGTSTMSEVASALTKSDKMPGLSYDYQSAIRIKGSKPRLIEFIGTPNQMDRHILEEAERLVRNGHYWEDMACIYRSHRTVNRMITHFSGSSIPHNILGSTQKDQDSNARCITSMLALTLNPHDTKAFSIAAAAESTSRPRRFNRTITKKIEEEAKANGTNMVVAAGQQIDLLKNGSTAQRNLHYLVRAWRELNEMMETPGVELYDLCRRANNLLTNAQRPSSNSGEEPQTFKLMTLSKTTPKMGEESLRELTARFLELMASALQPEHQSSENGDPFAHGQGITFGTIHSTKGMQWKIVWVVDVGENDMPVRWDDSEEALLEEERIFYVAATRATDQMYFCYARQNEKAEDIKPSHFLEALEDLLETEEARPSSERPPAVQEPPAAEYVGEEEEPEEEPDPEPEMGG